MKKYGLIGFPLTHSFSKKYFSEKFEKEGIADCLYENFEIETVDSLKKIISDFDELQGINVTIPHKQAVIPLLHKLDPAAEKIGAVNVIKIESDNTLIGYNSDYYGFQNSLIAFIGDIPKNAKALILGTGGASKAIKVALEDLGITTQYVSRTKSDSILAYEEISEEILNEYRIIVNCTPLGTFPNTDNCPTIPYQFLNQNHFLYDLVYNPEETLFMKKGKQKGAKVKNGLDMLTLQAEKAWEIWNA